jgi:hypothetical protein
MELKSRAPINFIPLQSYSQRGQSRTAGLLICLMEAPVVIVGHIIEQVQIRPNSNSSWVWLEGIIKTTAPHALYCTIITFINQKATGSFTSRWRNGTDYTLRKEHTCLPGAQKQVGCFIGTTHCIGILLITEINNSIDAIGFVECIGL